MRSVILLSAGLLVAAWAFAQSDDIATLRKAPLEAEPEAPRIASELNTDVRQARNYPEQPPLIPHKIEGYQIDLNSNKCLSCHNRHRVEESQAPMISVTHYMDRDMQVLAEVSPRRYFCLQCHIPQTDARPLVDNTFEDVTEIIAKKRAAGQ